MKVKRELLLQTLEQVAPGLSQREIVEQSNNFIFRDNRVQTYNDEISCIHRCPIGITGAVPAQPLLEQLRKWQEEEVEISNGNGELLIKGRGGRAAGIRMDAEITLPTEALEKPTTWRPLPREFCEAIDLVQGCAGKDETAFESVCVHIHTEWIEACDNTQLARYRIKTGIQKPILIRQLAAKNLLSLGVTEMAETPAWVHFRAPSGLVLSCRRHTQDFYDLAEIIDVQDGKPLVLPKGLSDAADKASVFSAENTETDKLLVELRPGKCRVRGEGISGWYQEVREVQYQGPPLSFHITPAILSEVSTKYNNALICPNRLKVDGGNWVFVTFLETVQKDPA